MIITMSQVSHYHSCVLLLVQHTARRDPGQPGMRRQSTSCWAAPRSSTFCRRTSARHQCHALSYASSPCLTATCDKYIVYLVIKAAVIIDCSNRGALLGKMVRDYLKHDDNIWATFSTAPLIATQSRAEPSHGKFGFVSVSTVPPIQMFLDFVTDIPYLL